MLFTLFTLALAQPLTDDTINDSIRAYTAVALEGARFDLAVDNGHVRIDGSVPDAQTYKRLEHYISTLDDVASSDIDLEIRNGAILEEVETEDQGLSDVQKDQIVARMKAGVFKSPMVQPDTVLVRFQGDTLRVDGVVDTSAARGELERLADDLDVPYDIDVLVQ